MKKAAKTKARVRKSNKLSAWHTFPVANLKNNLRTNTGKAIIGGVTIGVVTGLLLATLYHSQQPGKMTAILSPMPTSGNMRKQATRSAALSSRTSISRKATESAVVVTGDTLPVSIVKKLPFTASAPFTYTIRDGDNLAKIGNTFCEDTREYLYLIEINNLPDDYNLHPGDQITVSCE